MFVCLFVCLFVCRFVCHYQIGTYVWIDSLGTCYAFHLASIATKSYHKSTVPNYMFCYPFHIPVCIASNSMMFLLAVTKMHNTVNSLEFPIVPRLHYSRFCCPKRMTCKYYCSVATKTYRMSIFSNYLLCNSFPRTLAES
jgi:hypothetical protein